MADNSHAALRKQLAENLRSGHAHADFAQSIKDFPSELRGKRPEGALHSPWEVLEHMRIAQWDILEFSRNGEHESPKWPEGYWPPKPEPADDKAWHRSVHQFRQDTDAFCQLIEDGSNDLLAKIPHGDGQTLLREALLAADHNAYHLGELVLLRRLLGAWNPE
jgi:DinB superfamily